MRFEHNVIILLIGVIGFQVILAWRMVRAHEQDKRNQRAIIRGLLMKIGVEPEEEPKRKAPGPNGERIVLNADHRRQVARRKEKRERQECDSVSYPS